VNRLFPLALAALCLSAPALAGITSFQHIILVIQENRTPDNLFYGLCTIPSACSIHPSSQQYNIQTTDGWTTPRPPARLRLTRTRSVSDTIWRTFTPPSLQCAI
jgi:phospholipase C